jgi:ankyrin repeat protein
MNMNDEDALIMDRIHAYESIVQELLAKGADVNARDYYGTPVDWAARHHRTTILEMLKRHQQSQSLNT